MRRRAVVLSLAAAVGGVTAPRAATKIPERVLFVGNSYLYYGDGLHSHVLQLAREAYPGRPFGYRLATVSGARLGWHDLSVHLTVGERGVTAPYDVVVLQGHSRAMATATGRALFDEALAAMDAEIDASGARTALYMTPAYAAWHPLWTGDMLARNVEGYVAAGMAADALVIPVALAFARALEARPDLPLHRPGDGSHPTILGTYLAAATVFASLYPASAAAQDYTYFGAVAEADAAFLRRVADETVGAFHAR